MTITRSKCEGKKANTKLKIFIKSCKSSACKRSCSLIPSFILLEYKQYFDATSLSFGRKREIAFSRFIWDKILNMLFSWFEILFKLFWVIKLTFHLAYTFNSLIALDTQISSKLIFILFVFISNIIYKQSMCLAQGLICNLISISFARIKKKVYFLILLFELLMNFQNWVQIIFACEILC